MSPTTWGWLVLLFPLLGTIIIGCVMVAPLRRMAYEGAPTDAAEDVSTADPAIAVVLAARARRDEARKLAAKSLFLGSNSVLKSAVHLYESIGFRHAPPEKLPEMHYSRANVFMEMPL